MFDIRLRTPVRRAFSRKTSFMGYAVLCAGVAGSLIFTLVTRAKQPVCSTWWMSPSNAANNLYLFDRGVCSSTIVNSGQTFSNAKSTYVWSAVTWANFTRPAALQNCALLDGSGMLVDSTVRSTPIVRWNLTYVCSPTSRGGSSDTVNVWEGRNLNLNSLVMSVVDFDLNHGNPAVDAVRDASLAIRSSTLTCADSPVLGFELYTSGRISYKSDSRTYATCTVEPGTRADPVSEQLRTLFNTSTSLALSDLNTALSPLPNVLFPCTTCVKKWRGAADLIWLIFVAVGSLWGAIYFAACALMVALEPETEEGSSQAAGAQFGYTHATTEDGVGKRESYSVPMLSP